MATRKTMVALAQSFIGCKESDGSHKQIIDLYNKDTPLPRGYKVKYTDSWCATFISALAILADATDIIPKECSCQKMIGEFQSLGRWTESDLHTPKAGDIIFYDWDDSGKGDNKGWSDHVGIVEKVSNGVITVIEGNYSNSVKRRTIVIGARYIRGFGLPKYTEEKVFYFPKYKGESNSLVDALKSLNIDSSKTHRKKIAAANGIKNYTYSSRQNTSLLILLKQGKLVKP